MIDVASLRAQVSGPVLARGDDAFVEEVACWAQGHDPNPDVAVGATSAADVAAAVTFARANDLRVRMQATGHNSHAAIDDGLLIVTKRMTSVSIDADAAEARIGAGALWSDVVDAAANFGLAPITGSSPTVGAIGYLLGGGLGPLARAYGFSSDFVREFEVVTADGTITTASVDTNPDLFWALRGGKGGLAVVTSATVRLVDLPTLYGGSLMFDAPDIEPALRAWAAYTSTAENDVTTSVAIMRMPDEPFIPEPIRGRTLLSVRFAYPGDATRGEKLAAPLRDAAPVYIDALAQMPASAIGSIHADPPDPTPSWTRGGMLTAFDDATATALLEVAGPANDIPFVSVEVRHIGSRTRTDVPEGSAVGGRGSDFTLNLVGAPVPALFGTAIPGAASGIIGALTPWMSPETTVNFVDGFADDAQFRASWSAETFDRLVAVRSEYDPDGLFPYGPDGKN